MPSSPTSFDDVHETEIKFYAPDLEALRTRLDALGAPLVQPRVLERNIRYDTEDNEFTKSGTVLRLREDGRNRLTYKDGERYIGALGSTRFEAEVEVSDFRLMQVILIKLGFKPVLIYEKYRTTYALAGAEVMLDELPYGTFAEIEGDETTIAAALDQLGLRDVIPMRYSYVVLFQQLKRRYGWAMPHLTFDAFSGISVPADAFNL